MHTRSVLAAVAAATFFSTPAFAELVVDFTGDLVATTTSSVNLGNRDPLSAAADFYSITAFTGVTAALPYLEGSTLPKLAFGSSARWLGKTAGIGAKNLASNANSDPDLLFVNYQRSTDNTVAVDEFNLLVTINKAEFAALTDGPVAFDGSSSMSVFMSTLNGVDSYKMNWVVKNGSTYYMSTNQLSATSLGGPSLEYTLANPAGGTWVVFDPLANNGVKNGDIYNITSANGSTLGATTVVFNDIQAVGFFAEGSGVVTANTQLGFYDLQVSAVPEPGTMVVLGGAVAFGFLRRRKHA